MTELLKAFILVQIAAEQARLAAYENAMEMADKTKELSYTLCALTQGSRDALKSLQTQYATIR